MEQGPEGSPPSLTGLALRVFLLATLLELAVFLGFVVAHAWLRLSMLTTAADVTGMALGVTALVTLCLAAIHCFLVYPHLRKLLLFLVLLTSIVLAAHLYVINNPSLPGCRDTNKNVNGCIMDEIYYVPTAENMLRGTQCGPSVDNCNTEHPFLSKALIAAGIAAFGDGAFGWRIFDVILGTFSIPLLFALALRLSRSAKLATMASILLAADVMFFSQSSAALIDVPSVFFGLLAFVAYAYNVRVWVFDRFVVSGLFLGLAVLSKETGVLFLLTLVTYHLLASKGEEKEASRFESVDEGAAHPSALIVERLSGGLLIASLVVLTVMFLGTVPGVTTSSAFYHPLELFTLAVAVPFILSEGYLVAKERPWTRPAFVAGAKIIIASIAIFVVATQTYDSLFASKAFPTFVDQLRYMLTYGSSLTGGGWTYGNGIQITPISWMTYYQPVVYYGTRVSVCLDYVNKACVGKQISFPGVAYYGVTNLLETWLTYLWLPVAAIFSWKAYKARKTGPDESSPTPSGVTSTTPVETSAADGHNQNVDLPKVSLLAGVWFSWNYFPYILLWALGRVTYPFYIIPAIPAIALGCSMVLSTRPMRFPINVVFLAGVILFFFVFFPDKSFLPNWLRALINR